MTELPPVSHQQRIRKGNVPQHQNGTAVAVVFVVVLLSRHLLVLLSLVVTRPIVENAVERSTGSASVSSLMQKYATPLTGIGIAGVIVQLILAIVIAGIVDCGMIWRAEWQARYRRSDARSPSNKRRPAVGDIPSEPQAARWRWLFLRNALPRIARLDRLEKQGPGALQSEHRSPALKKPRSLPQWLGKKQRASRLEMDHVYMPFFLFLWCNARIGVHGLWLATFGPAWLYLREFVHARGAFVSADKWFFPCARCDAAGVVGRLCVESIGVAIHFAGKRRAPRREFLGTRGVQDNEARDNNCQSTMCAAREDHFQGCPGDAEKSEEVLGGTFSWRNLPYLNSEGQYVVAKRFDVEIDLEAKRYIYAELDGKRLSAADTLTLLWFITISSAHVQEHAFGNWAVNIECGEGKKEVHPYLRTIGAITAYYNWLGHSVFMRQAQQSLFAMSGCIPSKYFDGIPLVWDAALAQGVPSHMQLDELAPHSELVSFVIALRSKVFLRCFQRHAACFPGVDSEALFVGTVLHSLDHTTMEWNIADPLWIGLGGSAQFEALAAVGRYIRVGFVADLPALTVAVRYRDAPMQFFRDVYRGAMRLEHGQVFAPYMDTCIVK